MKFKKISSVLLALLLAASSLAIMSISVYAEESVTEQKEEPKSEFEYEITAAGTAVITDYDGNIPEVTVPGAIDGYQVTAIGRYSMSYNKYLEKIIIPNGVTSIGYGAFSENSNLKTVEIPESVTSIRGSAFEDDEMLTDVTLPSKITSIECSLFDHTAIKSINIPDGVKTIDSYAFYGCQNLESVEMPDSVNELGNYAFANCKKLNYVKLSMNLKVVPEYAFNGTESLTKISLPSKITKISNRAFYGSGIKSVSIGKNFKTLGTEAFGSCPKLEKFTVNAKNKNYYSKSGVLYNKKKTLLITYPAGKTSKKFTVTKNVRRIDQSAFVGNANLEEVTFKKGVKTICSSAFQGTSIKKLNLPSSVKTIGTSAFEKCESLESVKIPTSVTQIKYAAFQDCSALKKLDFKGNSNLAMGSSVFRGCIAIKTVSAPIAKSCDGRTFFACTHLKKVKFSKNVKKIFREDYAECTNLNSVTVPATVKKIATRAIGYINYYDYDFDRNDNLVIKGYKNSAAQKYAKDNGFTFKKIK